MAGVESDVLAEFTVQLAESGDVPATVLERLRILLPGPAAQGRRVSHTSTPPKVGIGSHDPAEAIRIEEFRGICQLELDLDCASLVVLRPNGSGKSGVGDAIDRALTGNIARLSGSGTGGVSSIG